MKEHNGLILKVIIGIAGAVICILFWAEIIPPPFGLNEIFVGLVGCKRSRGDGLRLIIGMLARIHKLYL